MNDRMRTSVVPNLHRLCWVDNFNTEKKRSSSFPPGKTQHATISMSITAMILMKGLVNNLHK